MGHAKKQLFFALHYPPDAYAPMSKRAFARLSSALARLGHDVLRNAVQGRTLERGDGLLSQGDVESNAVPGDDLTRGVVDAAEFVAVVGPIVKKRLDARKIQNGGA